MLDSIINGIHVFWISKTYDFNNLIMIIKVIRPIHVCRQCIVTSIHSRICTVCMVYRTVLFTRKNSVQTIYKKEQCTDYLQERTVYRLFTRKNSVHTIYKKEQCTDYLHERTVYRLFTTKNSVKTIYKKE